MPYIQPSYVVATSRSRLRPVVGQNPVDKMAMADKQTPSEMPAHTLCISQEGYQDILGNG